MKPLTENDAWLILANTPYVGPLTLAKLLGFFGHNPLHILQASPNILLQIPGIGKRTAQSILEWQKAFCLEKAHTKLQKFGAQFIHQANSDYPTLLKTIYDPPIGLYAKGQLEALRKRTLAIIGSRLCSPYGRKIAYAFSYELASCGFCIVSGLARGIDTEAHKGALEAKGATVGILGCGLDLIYPPENKDLYDSIKSQGLLLSEFPFGKKADRTSFPRRNRIISGLSEAVIVIETGRNGGSIITAQMANDQGRTVFAIPGRIDSESSHGCHDLIREGAILCTSVDDVLSELTSEFPAVKKPLGSLTFKAPPPELQGLEKVLFERLNASNACIDTLAQSFDAIPVGEISAHLMALELKGLIQKNLDGTYQQG